MTVENLSPTIGILYPGEMGAALANVFLRNGLRVVSTVQGRSDRTRSLAATADLELLPNLPAVVQTAEILVSTVTPHAARQLAAQVCRCQPTKGKVFVDANSIAPDTALQIAAACEVVDVEFVDMAIRGQADSLVESGAVYLSGAHASRIERILHPLEVEIVGLSLGSASLLKMMMSGMSKGLAAQFIELSLTAHRAGMLDRFLIGIKRYYPDVYAALSKVLPSYAQHVGRRAEELAEVESCLRDLRLRSEVVAGGKRLLECISRVDLSGLANLPRDASLGEQISALAEQAPLRIQESTPAVTNTATTVAVNLHS